MAHVRSLFSSLLIAAAFGALSLTRLAAQGGPPMITDDPGTPGPNHWEINLGWTDQRTAGETLYGLPLLDANYGVGDRLQLTYVGAWSQVREEDGSRSGDGNSLVGFKYRFLDEGDKGWQASIYPQYTFVNPGSDSVNRGLAIPGSSLLLPFEFVKDLGPVAMDFDFGHVFNSIRGGDTWMGGVVLGREVVKGWELDAEVHVNASNTLDRSETILNFGTRIDFSEHLTLMIALGRDLTNHLAPKSTLLSYVGFQLRL